MKNNLINSFALQLDYMLSLHAHIDNVSYKITGDRLVIEVVSNELGTYHNVSVVYQLLNADLGTYTAIEDGVMVISVF